MKYYQKKDHGIDPTLIGIVNVLRYSLKIECCKNPKKCKGWMTFMEVLRSLQYLLSKITK